MATDDDQTRNKLRFAGLVAGLCVWTALSGIGSLSAPAGFFLAALTYWMLTGLLVWAVCKGDTGGEEQPPVNESEGLPGWLLLVVVLALLVWIGLSGVGDMSGSAGFVFALLAMIGLTGLVIWARSGDDAEDSGDHRFAMLPEEEEADEDAAATLADSAAGATIAALAEPSAEPAAAQAAALSAEAAVLAQVEAARAAAAAEAGEGEQAATEAGAAPAGAETPAGSQDGAAPVTGAEAAATDAGAETAGTGAQAGVAVAEVPDAETQAGMPSETGPIGAAQAETTTGHGAVPDDLKRIKGIGPALEKTLNGAGVTRFAQIAEWDEAEIDAMAARLGRLGGRIRHDDWKGQARALMARTPADGG